MLIVENIAAIKHHSWTIQMLSEVCEQQNNLFVYGREALKTNRFQPESESVNIYFEMIPGVRIVVCRARACHNSQNSFGRKTKQVDNHVDNLSFVAIVEIQKKITR